MKKFIFGGLLFFAGVFGAVALLKATKHTVKMTLTINKDSASNSND